VQPWINCENRRGVNESSQSPPGLRILAATVNSDLALDGGSVVAIDMHFPCGASEASAGAIDCFLLRVGRGKRP
jgi:hypothetical protein